MTYTTLAYNGVEKSLADWSVSAWSRTAQNQAQDSLLLTIPTPMDGADLFPFGAKIIVQIGRITSAVNPVNPTLPVSVASVPSLSYSGGTQWFVGYCVDNDRVGAPDSESFTYKFAGPYEFFFTRTIFQKLQLTWNEHPASGAARNFADWQSDVVLGLSLTVLTGSGDTVQGTTATNLMSLAQQVKEICMFAQTASSLSYGSPQFQCDQLTSAIDGINWDLLATPSANVLIKDYYGAPLAGKTSAVSSQLLTVPGTAPAIPGTYILRPPLDAINAVTCADALRRVLQWIGGIGSPQVWTDHSQSPPQLRVATPDLISTADPGNTTTPQRTGGGYVLNLPLAGLTVKNKIKKRSDLVPAAVHFKYKVNGTLQGAPYSIVINDIAAVIGGVTCEGVGTVGSLYDVNNPTTLLSGAIQTALINAALLPSAVVQTIDIQGAVINASQATIATASIINALGSAGDPVWTQLFPDLASASGLAFFNNNNPGVSITDAESGQVYYTGAGGWAGATYNDVLLDGQIAPWMAVNNNTPGATVKAVISGNFSYATETAIPGGNASIGNVTSHPRTVTVTLTNLASGTYTSSPTGSSGEPVPFGLAGYILALESIPQYEGSILVQETEISDVCPLGNRLNITSDLAEWASMGAQVQSVRYADNGQTEITFGPAKHLGPAQFVARFRNNVGPRWYNLIAINPLNTGNNTAALGSHLPAQGPSPAQPNWGLQRLLTNLVAAPDPTNLPAGVHLDSGATDAATSAQRPSGFPGAPSLTLAQGGTSSGWIRLSVADLPPKAQAYFQNVQMCDGSGNPITGAYVLAYIP